MSKTIEQIAEEIKKAGCTIKTNEPMRNHTTFRIGGNADIFVTLRNAGQLVNLLRLVKDEEVKLRFIGNGSNLLVSDDGLRGIVAKLEGDFCEIKMTSDNTLRAGAGATLSAFCNAALNNSLGGMEFAWGIPGSVGGAVFMNAGAYGGEMKDIITEVEYITPDGNIETISRDECGFTYRGSIFQNKPYIITSATVLLEHGEPSAIKEKMDDILGRRKDKQPLDMPSAGSVFKRPEGYYAGGLIERCALKGKTIGGAQVSEKHAGFIVNIGNATCEDVLSLVKFIQKTVFECTGVALECEIKAIHD